MIPSRQIAVFAGGALLASSALAQTPRLLWTFSTDDGLTWQSSGNALTNSTVKMRGTVDWSGVSAYGFAGLTHQVFIENHDSGDEGAQVSANGVGNRIAPFNFGAVTLAVRVEGTTQRIVGLGIGGVEGGISNGQPAAAQDFIDPINPAPIFQFDYRIGDVANRTLHVQSVVGASNGVSSSFSFYSSATSSGTSFRMSGEVIGASINIVPAGGTTAAFAMALLALPRRPRRHD